MAHKITIKRAYEKASKDDGIRILVDRLWPQGVSKQRAHLDYWFKELAPSTELRKWYNHEPDKYKKFVEKYKKELKSSEAKELIDEIHRLAKSHKITLIFAAKDVEHSNAVVLEKLLNR